MPLVITPVHATKSSEAEHGYYLPRTAAQVRKERTLKISTAKDDFVYHLLAQTKWPSYVRGKAWEYLHIRPDLAHYVLPIQTILWNAPTCSEAKQWLIDNFLAPLVQQVMIRESSLSPQIRLCCLEIKDAAKRDFSESFKDLFERARTEKLSVEEMYPPNVFWPKDPVMLEHCCYFLPCELPGKRLAECMEEAKQLTLDQLYFETRKYLITCALEAREETDIYEHISDHLGDYRSAIIRHPYVSSAYEEKEPNLARRRKITKWLSPLLKVRLSPAEYKHLCKNSYFWKENKGSDTLKSIPHEKYVGFFIRWFLYILTLEEGSQEMREQIEDLFSVYYDTLGFDWRCELLQHLIRWKCFGKSATIDSKLSLLLPAEVCILHFETLLLSGEATPLLVSTLCSLPEKGEAEDYLVLYIGKWLQKRNFSEDTISQEELQNICGYILENNISASRLFPYSFQTLYENNYKLRATDLTSEKELREVFSQTVEIFDDAQWRHTILSLEIAPELIMKAYLKWCGNKKIGAETAVTSLTTHPQRQTELKKEFWEVNTDVDSFFILKMLCALTWINKKEAEEILRQLPGYFSEENGGELFLEMFTTEELGGLFFSLPKTYAKGYLADPREYQWFLKEVNPIRIRKWLIHRYIWRDHPYSFLKWVEHYGFQKEEDIQTFLRVFLMNTDYASRAFGILHGEN